MGRRAYWCVGVLALPTIVRAIRVAAKAGASAQGVVAAAAICPGYQIPEAFCNVKPLFQRILTSKLQTHFLEGNADVLRAAPAHDAAYVAAMGSKSILEFVDAVRVTCLCCFCYFWFFGLFGGDGGSGAAGRFVGCIEGEF